MTKTIPDLVAWISYSETTKDIMVLKFEGNDAGYFDDGYNSESTRLIIPESLVAGIYYCQKFYTCNVSTCWETGMVEDFDLKCTWELLRSCD